MNYPAPKLPESYRFYLEQQNREAFSQIDGAKKFPANFAWEDVCALNHARFSLEITKYEYYVFLCDLWKATWGYALDQLNGLEPCKAGQYIQREAPLSPEDVWNDRLIRLYHKDGKNYWFGISVPSLTPSVCLSLYIEDKEGCALSSNIALETKYWEEKEDSLQYRTTKLEPLCFKEGEKNESAIFENAKEVAQSTIETLQQL